MSMSSHSSKVEWQDREDNCLTCFELAEQSQNETTKQILEEYNRQCLHIDETELGSVTISSESLASQITELNKKCQCVLAQQHGLNQNINSANNFKISSDP